MLPRLIETAISAGWLILAVIALRAVFRRAPRGMICLLWALAALRLACPFSIRSPLSLVPDTEAVVERVVSIAAPVREQTNTTTPETAVPVPAENVDARPSGPDIAAWATAVWAAGTAGMLGYAAVSYIRLRQRVAASVRVKGNIFLCDWIDTPFILGVFRPRIYLPSAMDRERYTYVLAHENAHLKRRDHWWKPLGFVLLAVYWFDPLAWAAYILFCWDLELACDERVIRDMGLAERKEYSKILLACAAGAVPSVCPVRFGGVGVKARIKSVLRYRRPALGAVIAGGVAAAVLAVCFLTDPAESLAAVAEEPAPSPVTHIVPGEEVAARNGPETGEEDFAAMLAEEWTSEGYEAMTYEEFAARYDETLVPLDDPPAGYENIGYVFVKAPFGEDEPGQIFLAEPLIVQVLYNANIEAAVTVQQWRTDEGDTQPFFTYSDCDEIGRPLADECWYSWLAGYDGSVGGTTVNMALCSVRDLGGKSCWLTLRALWPDW